MARRGITEGEVEAAVPTPKSPKGTKVAPPAPTDAARSAPAAQSTATLSSTPPADGAEKVAGTLDAAPSGWPKTACTPVSVPSAVWVADCLADGAPRAKPLPAKVNVIGVVHLHDPFAVVSISVSVPVKLVP
jgi:hypothetical protein